MIEAGILLRLQADAGVTAACGSMPIDFDSIPDDAPGGIELQVISRVAQDLLEGDEGVIKMRLQISCMAKRLVTVLALDKAIRACLRGFEGTLPDPDHTEVAGITVGNQNDGYVGDNRLRRRATDFLVLYVES